MANKTFILIFIAAVFIVGGILYIYNPNPEQYDNPNEEEPAVCTLDAKLCPDGSYVGRIPPSCEFEACPAPSEPIFEDGTIIEEDGAAGEPDEQIFCTADVKLCPDGSYVGRVAPKCEFAKCP